WGRWWQAPPPPAPRLQATSATSAPPAHGCTDGPRSSPPRSSARAAARSPRWMWRPRRPARSPSRWRDRDGHSTRVEGGGGGARRRGPRPARRPDHRAGCGGRAAARGRRAAGMTATYTRLVSRRAVLWIAFAVVHAVIATLGYLLPSDPMGDVGNVYDPWSRAALAGHIVGVHE